MLDPHYMWICCVSHFGLFGVWGGDPEKPGCPAGAIIKPLLCLQRLQPTSLMEPELPSLCLIVEAIVGSLGGTPEQRGDFGFALGDRNDNTKVDSNSNRNIEPHHHATSTSIAPVEHLTGFGALNFMCRKSHRDGTPVLAFFLCISP